MKTADMLEMYFSLAEGFVSKHYTPVDSKDRGIKILATINQLIEIEKLLQQNEHLEALRKDIATQK